MDYKIDAGSIFDRTLPSKKPLNRVTVLTGRSGESIRLEPVSEEKVMRESLGNTKI